MAANKSQSARVAKSNRTDLYLMQPRNSTSSNMRSRLSAIETLNIQDGPTLVAPGKFIPKSGAVLIYHLTRLADLELIRQQILTVARTLKTSYNNIVICGLRDESLRKAIEALPQTVFVVGDVSGHDSDLVVQRMIRRWNDIAAENAAAQKSDMGPFVEVKAKDEQSRLVKDAVDSRGTVVISPYGSPYELKGYFFGYDEHRQILQCQVDGLPQELAQCRKDAEASKRLALSLSLKQSRVFFATTDFHWVKDSALDIKAPSLIYFVQRRKNFRHVVYPEGRHSLLIEAGGREISLEIHDISVGGLSVVCAAEDLAALKNAKELSGARFQIEGQTIGVERLLLRHARKFRSGDLFQVGLSFERISPACAETIARFVNARIARYFQTYVVSR